MIEIRNGKTKRMIALLAQDSTLSLLQAMRGGSWLSCAELEPAVHLESEVLVSRLEALVSLGVVRTREDDVRRWRGLFQRLQISGPALLVSLIIALSP